MSICRKHLCEYIDSEICPACNIEDNGEDAFLQSRYAECHEKCCLSPNRGSLVCCLRNGHLGCHRAGNTYWTNHNSEPFPIFTKMFDGAIFTEIDWCRAIIKV